MLASVMIFSVYETIDLFLYKFCRSHITMVKAVVVLSSSEGVSGTVHFTQEGDGICHFH